MKFKFLPKEKINKLPKNPGVYTFKNRSEILYIGKASNIRERVRNHFQSVFAKASARQATFRDSLFIDKVTQVGYLKTDSEIEALILEANLIKKYQPKYNVLWRDDKNYFYVGFTKEDLPRVFITHQIKFKVQSLKFKVEYVGPFVDGTALKQTLKILRKVFPYRTCKTLPNRPCLWYQLDRCPAPCLLKSSLGKQIPNAQIQIKKDCQRNAKNVMEVIKSKKAQVLKKLKKEMKLASLNQDFERAAKIRDQILALEKVLAHSKVFSPENQYRVNSAMANYCDIERRLKKILKIKKRVSRIEAYDISNIQGQEATGSMVTFINGFSNKNFYRKFKIKYANSARSAEASRNANAHMRIEKPNDIAMIREVLNRRFKHPEWPFPDLILIDGGKAQLNAALKVVRSNLTKTRVMALAKKKNELFIEEREKPILLKHLPREIFNLILQLRDEAHRFAISYHRKLREVDFSKKF